MAISLSAGAQLLLFPGDLLLLPVDVLHRQADAQRGAQQRVQERRGHGEADDADRHDRLPVLGAHHSAGVCLAGRGALQ